MAAAALSLSCGGVLVATATPAIAASCNSGIGTTWAIAHLGINSDGTGGQQAVVQADSWGGGNACLLIPGSISAFAGAFTVESQTAAATGGVLSYPNTGIGCSSGYCTTPNGLPFAVSANPDPSITWGYDTSNALWRSKYDTLIDSEFSASCTGAAPPMNAAVAIYTDGFPSYKSIGVPSSGPTVSIDGFDWYTGHFLDGSKYAGQFALAEPSAIGVSGLTTATPTPTPTPTATAIGTPTPIPSNSSTPSASPSPTDSSTPDPTDSSTPSASPTSS